MLLGNHAVCYIYFHIFNIILGTLYSGYVMFCWIYGVCNGGYAYTLKMYIYEKVRARNFARAWSFTQMAMGLALVIGLPLSSVVKRVREQVHCLIAFGTKGQIISECPYEIIVCPKIATKNFPRFLP